MKFGLDENKCRIEALPKTKSKCPICNSELIPKCGVVKVWHWSHKNLTDCDSWAESESEWHMNWKNNFDKKNQEVVIEKDGQKHRADIKLDNGKVIELQNSSISPDDICDRELFYNNMVWLLNGDTFCKNFELRNKGNYLTFRWKNPPQSFFESNKNIFIDFSKKYNLLKEKQDDINERLNLSYNALKESIGGEEPNEYNFKPEHKYNYGLYNLSEKDKKIREEYLWWSEISEELRENEKELNLFKGDFSKEKYVFLLKKLYKEIPCGGWGYLISKEDFLRMMKNG